MKSVRFRQRTAAWTNLVITAACVFFCLGETGLAAGRTRVSLNSGWRFTAEDPVGAERSSFNTTGWKTVSVPHTWNTEDPFDDTPGYRRAPSWYRRTFQSPATDGRTFLYFEGANQTARVYVNEKLVGEHVGGYTAFIFDVTDYLKKGGSNLLAVRVDNTRDLDKPPIDGDFNIYGGIYRDVWLITTEKVHVKTTDFASSGIKVETPEVDAMAGNVRVSGTIVNSDKKPRNIQIVNTLLDPKGKVVFAPTTDLSLEPESEKSFQADDMHVAAQRLWSPDEPNLYTVRTTIRENGRVLDEVSNPLGFRFYRFDPEKGFFLNGEPLKLRGTNRHQDRQGLGSAVPDVFHVRDFEIIKENGFNFVRLAHYPQDPAVLEAADRLGLMLWEEIPVVNQMPVSAKFDENAKHMLTEMIRQHRNHPSVIIWGFMNEVFLGQQKPPEVIKATVDLARELQAICKREDPSRTTAIAFDRGGQYHNSGLDKITDIVGWNLYFGWYYDNFEDFGKFLDEEHRKYPDRPLIISEYGANGDRRVHSLAPKKFDSSIEWQRMYHEAYLPQINARKYVAGAAIWNQFDFGSEFRGETIPHVNQKGLYKFDRSPKDVAYYYRANYSDKPVLHIATADWPYRGGPAAQKVDVYTNAQSVELFVNGKSAGKATVSENKKATFDVNFKPGSNTLNAVGRRYGKTIRDAGIVVFQASDSLTAVALNCGTNVEYLDRGNTIWQAETPNANAIWRLDAQSSKPAEVRVNILKTGDDQVFQTMREGEFTYHFGLPRGRYEIELRFVETKFKETGKRVFDVVVNGTTAISGLDIFKKEGFMTRHTETISATATENGIDISVTARNDQPVLSGIKIRAM